MNNDITITMERLIEIATIQEKEIREYSEIYRKIVKGDEFNQLEPELQARIASVFITLSSCCDIMKINLTQSNK